MVLRPRPLILATAALATGTTALVTLVPGIAFAYRSPPLHVALSVAAALIGLLAAYLVYGRYGETGRVDDLMLVCALAVTAVANLFFAAIPAALATLLDERFATWAAVSGRLLGALLLPAAAFAPSVRLRHPRRDAQLALFACAGALLLMGAVAWSIGERLPVGVDPSLSPAARGKPLLAGHAGVHGVQLLAFVLFAAAAIGFGRRAARGDGELMTWLAGACVLGAFARLHYFLFPSLYSDWVYTGDLFRLGFYALLLAGAAREITGYQRRARESAVLEERQRLARELHDGLAQELGFLVMLARSRAITGAGPGELGVITTAAERALDEARRAIGALTRPLDEPLDVTLAQTVEEVAHRSGTAVRFDLAADVHIDARAREELLRVVREAVTNAGRHARASTIEVGLENRDGVRVRIHDDGIGFDPERLPDGGRGLEDMRERTRMMGAELRIASSPGNGTEVEVLLPGAR